MPILKLMKKVQSEKVPGYKKAAEYVFKLLVISLCSYYSETDILRSKELLKISKAIACGFETAVILPENLNK